MKNRFKTGIVSRYWWIPLITGLIGIGLGIWCICDPRDSLPVLAYAFAICMTVAGCANMIFAVSNNGYYGWGWSLCLGILELICGIWMWCLPMPELVITFMYLIGIWILVVAIDGVCESCMLIATNPFWVIWMLVMLFCAIGFSIVFLWSPLQSAYIEWLWLGISLITYGVYRIMLSTRLKSLGKNTDGLI